MISKFNAVPVKNTPITLTSGLNNGTSRKDSNPIPDNIPKRASYSQSVDTLSGTTKTKTKEEIDEEKKLKREKMREKMGNSTRKLIAKKEEEKKIQVENFKNNENVNVKIKSLANMFEGKITVATDSLQKRNSNENNNQNQVNRASDMSEKLNKLYGENANNLKQVELEVEIDDDENQKDCSNSNKKNSIITVKRKITVTKLSIDRSNNEIEIEKEKEKEKNVKKTSLIEENKPQTFNNARKFKKPDFKLDK
jgi:hypothetical protein